MATQAQQPGQMSLPLQNEMQLANWIGSMFSGKTANPNYTGAQVQAPQLVNQMSGQDLQNLMTEYMRGQGGFLQAMQQQNQSGLYNTNTRQLVANDITAQAALKASQANVPIQQGNASLMNSYYAKQAAQQPKYLPNQGKNNALGGLAIAGLQELMKGLGKGKGKQGKEEGSSKEGTGVDSAPNVFEQIAEMFTPSAEVGGISDVAGGMSVDPQSFLADITGMQPDFGFGMSMDPGLNLDFGSQSFELPSDPYDSFSFTPDTYESFQDSYGSAPGYDFQDYDEYFFD